MQSIELNDCNATPASFIAEAKAYTKTKRQLERELKKANDTSYLKFIPITYDKRFTPSSLRALPIPPKGSKNPNRKADGNGIYFARHTNGRISVRVKGRCGRQARREKVLGYLPPNFTQRDINEFRKLGEKELGLWLHLTTLWKLEQKRLIDNAK